MLRFPHRRPPWLTDRHLFFNTLLKTHSMNEIAKVHCAAPVPMHGFTA
jgi:hypothetical protein